MLVHLEDKGHLLVSCQPGAAPVHLWEMAEQTGFWDAGQGPSPPVSPGTDISGMVLLWLIFLPMRHSTHSAISLPKGRKRYLDSHSSKTVHGGGERRNWGAGRKGGGCCVPGREPPHV